MGSLERTFEFVHLARSAASACLKSDYVFASLFCLRKTLALLVYLAVTGQRHRRESLVALLWPESNRASAQAGLRNALHALRPALGDGVLESDPQTVALARDSGIWVDVQDFRELLGVCRTHDHGTDEVCAACLEPLRTAVDLYRGDFLIGFGLKDSLSFDDWQLAQTETLRSEAENGLVRLIRCLRAERHVQQAKEYARRWLELDRMSEEAQTSSVCPIEPRSGSRQARGRRVSAFTICPICRRVSSAAKRK